MNLFCSIIDESEIVKWFLLLEASLVQFCQNKLIDIEDELFTCKFNLQFNPLARDGLRMN